MLLLAIRELVARRLFTILVAFGLLTGSLGFSVLSVTSQTTEAVLTGTIQRNWNGAFDLLVRPADSATELERSKGFVRPNYASNVHGGITLQQLQTIRAIPGVATVAPVAVVGTIMRYAPWTMSLASSDDVTVYHVIVTASAEGGLSAYPLDDAYIVSIPADRPYPGIGGQVTVGANTIVCGYRPVECVGGAAGAGGGSYAYPDAFPVVIAGIDPEAEASLDGLNTCLKSGRYLSASDQVATRGQISYIPVVASTRSFIDETLHVQVLRAANSAELPGGSSVSQAQWQDISDDSASVDSLYAKSLAASLNAPAQNSVVDIRAPMLARPPAYDTLRDGHLGVEPVSPNPGIFDAERLHYRPSEIFIPPEASDVWMHPVSSEPLVNQRAITAVGTYDPDCLPNFDPLAGTGLEIYKVPAVALPSGEMMGPSRNPASYVNPPPLILTNLTGAEWFARQSGLPGSDAFISVVRVKVQGVAAAGAYAEGRLARIAASIHDATGLMVDAVKGSSPKAVDVDLPPGRFGRPAVTVTEGWAVKGVAYRFSRAVAAQNVTLLALILIAATMLSGQTAYAGVKRRQLEFGVLRAIGWSALRLSWLVELELLVIGTIVGISAVAAGLALGYLLHLNRPWYFNALPLAIALFVAGLSGIVPALGAYRGITAARLAHLVPVHHEVRVRSIATLALEDLAAVWRVEALLSGAALAIGAALFGVTLMAALGFRGQLDTTVLGNYLSLQVAPFHVVLTLLTLLIGVLAAGQVMNLSYAERQPDYAMLRAIGWPKIWLASLLATEGLMLGIAGGVSSLVIVAVSGLALRAPLLALALGASSALCISLVAGILASLGSVLASLSVMPSEALRGE